MPAGVGVEGRLAHQTVDAGFGAQHAEAVFAGELDGRGLDAGHIPFRLFQHFDAVALALAVLDVHAQQHRRPVLGFGAAGAGLDVDEAVERVGRIIEHAAEFEPRDFLLDAVEVGIHGMQRIVVVLFACHGEELVGILEPVGDAVERQNDVLQGFLFLGEFLRAFGVVPDGRVFEFARDGFQLIRFLIVVKDTSEARPRAGRGRQGGWRWR